MKKLLFCLMAAAFINYAQAQQTDALERKYATYISVDDAKKHLNILASDAFEGRETGKAGAEKAANYIAGEFKKMGLQAPVNGSYFLNIPLEESTLRVSAFTVNGKAFTLGQDFIPNGTVPDKNVTAKEVVFVGYGTEIELGTTDLTNKVVLWINEDKPEDGKTPNTEVRMTTARLKVFRNLQSKNPAIILAVNGDLTALLKRFGRNIASPRLTIKEENKTEVAGVPVFHVSTAIADELLKSTGKAYVDLKAGVNTTPVVIAKVDFAASFANKRTNVKAVDVLGYLPGTDLKDEILVFSAHYDHIGLTTTGTDKVNNGADDDGSGTTGILEIARAFTQAKKDGHPARRSILFLGNVGEEKGLLGSEYYTDHPVFPLSQTITDLNIDMIGRTGYDYQGKADSSNYVYVIGSAMLSTDLHKINEEANNKFTKLDLDYKYDDPNDPNRFYYRSDHYNFAKHGVPIIFYFDGEHQDYHRPSDEVSKINFPMLVKRAQLVFYTGWELANRDKRPVVDAKSDNAASQ